MGKCQSGKPSKFPNAKSSHIGDLIYLHFARAIFINKTCCCLLGEHFFVAFIEVGKTSFCCRLRPEMESKSFSSKSNFFHPAKLFCGKELEKVHFVTQKAKNVSFVTLWNCFC